MEKMKRFKRRLSQTLRGSHTIDESLSELAEQMTIEENGLKDSGAFCYMLYAQDTDIHNWLKLRFIETKPVSHMESVM